MQKGNHPVRSVSEMCPLIGARAGLKQDELIPTVSTNGSLIRDPPNIQDPVPVGCVGSNHRAPRDAQKERISVLRHERSRQHKVHATRAALQRDSGTIRTPAVVSTAPGNDLRTHRETRLVGSSGASPRHCRCETLAQIPDRRPSNNRYDPPKHPTTNFEATPRDCLPGVPPRCSAVPWFRRAPEATRCPSISGCDRRDAVYDVDCRG